MNRILRTLPFFVLIMVPLFLQAADWPQYRGLNRDGISKETISKTWPAGGPKQLWRVPIGEGYSGIAVSQGRLYTMDAKGNNEFAVCLDAATGKEIWRVQTDTIYLDGQGNGPRSTPTVDGDSVFVVGAKGQFIALSAKDGKKLWSHNLQKEYGSEIPNWGTATSPLVLGNMVLADVGGKTGHSLMAFSRRDGSVLWSSHTDKQGYSSPVAVTVGGIKQIVFFTGTALVSVSPTGQVYWKYPWRTDWDANIATPLFIPPDKVFISTSYGVGAAVVKINATKSNVSVQEVWKSKVMENHFNSSVLHGEYIYGFDNAILKCIHALTGQEKWKQSGFGKGSLLLVDNHLIVLGERGQLMLVEATPTGYKEKGNLQVVDGKTWTMPTLANGKLYVRSQKEMVCLNVGTGS